MLFEVLMAVRAHLFKIDGSTLGVLMQVPFWGDGARVFLHLDGRVHGGMQFGWWCFGMLFGVRLGVWGGAVWGALRVTVQAHICEIDGRVQGACSLGCCCRCCFGMLFGGC